MFYDLIKMDEIFLWSIYVTGFFIIPFVIKEMIKEEIRIFLGFLRQKSELVEYWIPETKMSNLVKKITAKTYKGELIFVLLFRLYFLFELVIGIFEVRCMNFYIRIGILGISILSFLIFMFVVKRIVEDTIANEISFD